MVRHGGHLRQFLSTNVSAELTVNSDPKSSLSDKLDFLYNADLVKAQVRPKTPNQLEIYIIIIINHL